jgi:hypothetical protein
MRYSSAAGPHNADMKLSAVMTEQQHGAVPDSMYAFLFEILNYMWHEDILYLYRNISYNLYLPYFPYFEAIKGGL